jgi:hypothetical protein
VHALILDSGGVTRLAVRSRYVAALILELREHELWPPVVPSIVLVECLQGHVARDAHVNALLKTCDIVEEVPEHVARRAAFLQRKARRGSAVDALLVALAAPDNTVLTGDTDDLTALAQFSARVRVERI